MIIEDNVNIVVIYDDQMALTLLERLLGDMGYKVITARDCEEGLSTIAQMDRVDLVFIDNVLAAIANWDTLAKIKDIHSDAQVILIAASNDIIDTTSAANYGVFEYLTTPVDFRKLELAINRAMKIVRLNQEMRSLKLELSKAQGINFGKKPGSIRPYSKAKELFEKQYLEMAMALCGGNIVKVAKLTNIPRSNLYGKLKKHSLR